MSEKEKPKKVVTRLDLANAVADLLDLPHLGWQGEAYEVIQAFTQALTEALWRGERVKVDGFGIFEVRERKPMKRGASVFFKNVNTYTETILVPARKFVVFKPSKALLRFINGPHDC